MHVHKHRVVFPQEAHGRHPGQFKGRSHDVPTKDLAVNVTVLQMHEFGVLEHGTFHPNGGLLCHVVGGGGCEIFLGGVATCIATRLVDQQLLFQGTTLLVQIVDQLNFIG